MYEKTQEISPEFLKNGQLTDDVIGKSSGKCSDFVEYFHVADHLVIAGIEDAFGVFIAELTFGKNVGQVINRLPNAADATVLGQDNCLSVLVIIGVFAEKLPEPDFDAICGPGKV